MQIQRRQSLRKTISYGTRVPVAGFRGVRTRRTRPESFVNHSVVVVSRTVRAKRIRRRSCNERKKPLGFGLVMSDDIGRVKRYTQREPTDARAAKTLSRRALETENLRKQHRPGPVNLASTAALEPGR